MNIWDFFSDPVLRGPTIGSMLMCLSAAITGVLVYLRKQSLIGEALSHASYPGVILGVLFSTLIVSENNDFNFLSLLILIGAFSTAFVGYWIIQLLEIKIRIPSDAALCFVLSSFFGIGLTLASRIQFTHPTLYKQSQIYLYGQAATMTDMHIAIYLGLSILISFGILLFYKEFQTVALDRVYAKSLGISVKMMDALIFFMVVLSLILGIRSVGVILMSAMLIAPAAAARQYTHRLYIMFLLAGFFGLLSGFAGNYFSVKISEFMIQNEPESRFTLPTGPMIVFSASMICIFSLLFAPERGLVLRFVRAYSFKAKCLSENILKQLWRKQPTLSTKEIMRSQNQPYISIKMSLRKLQKRGLIVSDGPNQWKLTQNGLKSAARVVRLHRLWEVYLSDYLAMGAEKVHRSAEEMEHIITPDLEAELVKLLNDPQVDPHHQPIPPHNGSKEGL